MFRSWKKLQVVWSVYQDGWEAPDINVTGSGHWKALGCKGPEWYIPAQLLPTQAGPCPGFDVDNLTFSRYLVGVWRLDGRAPVGLPCSLNAWFRMCASFRLGIWTEFPFWITTKTASFVATGKAFGGSESDAQPMERWFPWKNLQEWDNCLYPIHLDIYMNICAPMS